MIEPSIQLIYTGTVAFQLSRAFQIQIRSQRVRDMWIMDSNLDLGLVLEASAEYFPYRGGGGGQIQ